MTRYALVLGLSIGTLASASGSAAVQTADEVVEKYLSALGGRAALSKITTRRGTGRVTLTTPGGDISGPIVISNKAPNKLSAVMELDLTPLGAPEKLTLQQKFDGASGWMLNSLQGDMPITGNQLDNMKGGSFPTPLLNYKAEGRVLELLPRATLAGKEYVVLKMTPKTGSAVTMYFDSTTNLLVRTAARVSSPEVGEVDQTTEISDYRAVGEIKVPFQTVNSSSIQTVTVKLDKVEHNVPMDDAIFTAKGIRP
jgi:outer membrane lipoprotein-sorting protein